MPFGLHTVGIELNELLCHILNRRTHTGLGLLPLGSTQPVQFDAGVLARTNVLGNHIQLCDWDIERVPFGIFQLDVILDDAMHIDLVDSFKDADSM